MENILSNFINTKGLSDLHIQSGTVLSLRINGIINKQDVEVLTNDSILVFLKSKLNEEQLDSFEKMNFLVDQN